MVRERTLLAPDATACVDEQRRLTYRELDLASDALAETIAVATGGRRGAVVVRLPRSTDLLVALLGVLKAGCWYLPISLDEPAARVRAMLDDAEPLAAVTGPANAVDGLQPLPVPAPPEQADLRPLRTVGPLDPVYVLFTSGSTGRPKGVLLGSAALCNRILWMHERYELAEHEAVLQKTPCTFDVSGWELFWPLVAGARCVLLPEGAQRDPGRIAATVAAHRVTTCHFVPSMLAEFLRAGHACPSLRRVFCSGEALPAAVAARFHEVFDAELHNLYGPTEAAIDVTHWPVPKSLRPDDPVPIGAPIDNTTLHVLDEAGRPVPAGERGELWIGGVPVALGYVNRPDLTEQAFRELSGQRCYRTGDLVRVRDGQVEYLGRLDDQIKVRGVRMEPGEIEHALAAHPAVAQAVAVVVDGTLLAATTPAGPDAVLPSGPELRAFVAARLPSAYVPSAIRWLPAIPVNGHGKADRGSLGTELAQWWARTREAAAADDSDLASMWWRLVAPTADPAAGFVSLGGHSLQAVRLVAWCRERFGVDVPLSFLLDDNASLGRLEELIAGAAPVARTGRTAVHDRPSGRLGPGQHRIWLWSRLHPESAAYNVVTVLNLTGEVSVTALREALTDVVARHDVLRARISGDEPVVEYLPAATPELVVRETPEPTDVERDAFVREIVGTPIPMDQAPMLRAGVLCGPSGRSCLAVSLHHVIADQRTAEIVLTGLAAAYAARSRGDRPELGPAPGYAGRAESEAGEVGSSRWQADLDHWRALLLDAPRDLRLPFRLAPGHPAGRTGEPHVRPLGTARSDRLRELAGAEAVTPAMLLLSAVAVVLGAWTGRHDLVLGVPASRRRTTEEHDMAGFLVDTLPVRIALDDHEDFRSLLAHVRRRQVDALQHSLPPFDAIVTHLGVPTRPDRHPLFQVWVNDLSQAAPPPRMPGLLVEQIDPPDAPALFDLNFYLRVKDGGYRLDLVRAVDRIPAEVADELADQCLVVLDQALARPAVRLAEIALGPPRPAPEPRSENVTPPLTEQVLAVAARSPRAVAVLGPDGTTLTYGQLADRVESMASRLRDSGVEPGDVVELPATRTTSLPVFLLAIWRAEAVAALLDSTLPTGRLGTCRNQVRPGYVLSGDGTPRPGVAAPRTLPHASHILFTSGSGGRPAGVVVSPEALAATMSWYASNFAMSPRDRVGLLSGLGHDPVLRDLLTPLLGGGTLVVPPADVFDHPALLFDFLRTRRITVLHATPALLELVLAGADGRLPALRLVVCGGAPLTAQLAVRIRTLGDPTVVNAYGTTETPQLATYHQVGDEPLSGETPVPVGTAIPGRQAQVIDEHGAPCGVGQLGEVVVTGSLATGYLDDAVPGRFVSLSSGEAAFRTGDLGRVDPWGRLHIDGRTDRQVLVNGLRVALEEIEAAALRGGGVSQATAALVTTEAGETLTLHVVGAPKGSPDAPALRARLAAELPRAAVPATIRFVDRLSRDNNHKVDREQTGAGAGMVVNGADPAVARLGEYIGALLDRPLGADENFFDAGLNSMAVLHLHSRLVREFGSRLVITDLFTHTTLRSLARFLGGAAPVPAGNRVLGAAPARSADLRRALRADLYRRDQETS
ncbi:amino acid adenylation domain-containing protein [Amycolatopsis sp. NPDC005003]